VADVQREDIGVDEEDCLHATTIQPFPKRELVLANPKGDLGVPWPSGLVPKRELVLANPNHELVLAQMSATRVPSKPPRTCYNSLGLHHLGLPGSKLNAIEGPEKCSHQKQTQDMAPWGLDPLDLCSSWLLMLQASTRAKPTWPPQAGSLR